MSQFTCNHCQKPFESARKRSFCSSSCRSRAYYHQRLYAKQCKYCSATFQGKKQEMLCVKCRGTRQVAEEKVKPLFCPRCQSEITGHKIVQTLHDIKLFSRGMCQTCKTISKKQQKARMQSDQNPSIQKFGRIVPVKRMTPEEFTTFQSARMKANNPMKQSEVVAKAQASRSKANIEYKRGSEHHLWKGNRDRGQNIRSRLYLSWIKKVMEQDDWTCQICQAKGGKLEVHHIFPAMRDLISSFAHNQPLDKLTEIEFEEVSQQTERYHLNGNVQAVTLCVDCHKKIDNRRR